MSLIEATALHKTYNSNGASVHALTGITLRVDRGEFIALLGPSGSGKSTLLTILGGMTPPTSGELVVDEIPIYSLSAEKLADFRHEYLGFIFQQLQLMPYLTAIENVMLPLSITKLGNAQQRQLAANALERVGLGGKLGRLPTQLSGGEQQRVAIARALVNEPPIILADEPTGNLDTRTGNEIMALLEKLNGEGQTIVFVTHNLELARRTHRTVSLIDGHLDTMDGTAIGKGLPSGGDSRG